MEDQQQVNKYEMESESDSKNVVTDADSTGGDASTPTRDGGGGGGNDVSIENIAQKPNIKDQEGEQTVKVDDEVKQQSDSCETKSIRTESSK